MSNTEEPDYVITQDMVDSIKLEGSGLTPKEQTYFETRALLLKNKLEELYAPFIDYKKIQEIKKLTPEKRVLRMDEQEFHSFYFNWDAEEPTPGDETRFSESGARYYSREIVAQCDLLCLETPRETRICDFYEGLIKEFGDDVHKYYFGMDIDESVEKQILAKVSEYDNPNDFNYYDQNPQSKTEEADIKGVHGMAVWQQMVITKDTNMYWDGANDTSRNNLIKKFGSEANAAAALKEATENLTLAHEIVHLYEPGGPDIQTEKSKEATQEKA